MRTTLLYRAGLCGVAVSLILLQAIYLGMVALVGWATWLWCIHFLPAVLTRLNFLTVMIAFGVPIAGAVTVFFLLKPVLARPGARPEKLSVSREDEPVLFAFVDRVCAAVGAPKPARIEMDLEVNASARFRRGWRGLIGNDLVLTIGLPLAGGLTVRQFAGVLAHEFGHFTQSAGMRLSFLIANIRNWFARVAYERDDWDIKLEERTGSGDWRLRLIFKFAGAVVTCSRWVLRGLLYVGNMISAWFSRQMEFDADRHEAELVGAGTFEETFNRIAELSVCSGQAWQHLELGWKTLRLADDVPMLIAGGDAAMDDEVRKSIHEAEGEQVTGRWATHPAMRDRVASVAGLAGCVEEALAERAPVLFSNFEELCRRATAHHYGIALGDRLAEGTILASASFLMDTAPDRERTEARESVFFALRMPSRWFRLNDRGFEGGELKVVVAFEDDSKGYWQRLEDSMNRRAGWELVRAGARIQPESFRVSAGDRETVERETKESRAAVAQEMANLRDRYGSKGYLLVNAPEDVQDAYRAFSNEQENLLELRHVWFALATLRGNLQFVPAANAANTLDHLSDEIRRIASGIVARLASVPSPIPQADGSRVTLAHQLLNGADASEVEKADAQEVAVILLERADTLGEDLLGELCRGFVVPV